jgi:EF-hand domain pair
MANPYHKAAQPYKGDFSLDEIDQFAEVFKKFDLDGNGSIDANELRTVVRDLGETQFTDKELQGQIDEVDSDKSGTVEFGEFLAVSLSSLPSPLSPLPLNPYIQIVIFVFLSIDY